MAKSDAPTSVRVYPSPDLPTGTFLAGVGIDGADVSSELAEEWLAAGLVTTTQPDMPAVDPSPPEEPAPPADEPVTPEE